MQTVLQGALNITYVVFQYKHVLGEERMHEKTHMLGNIKYVSTGKYEILQSTTKTLI